MLGAIIGDVVGSVYEFDNIKTKEFELFGEGNSFTDDTVMTVAVAKALIVTLENPRSFKEENHQFLLQYAVRLLRRHSPR